VEGIGNSHTKRRSLRSRLAGWLVILGGALELSQHVGPVGLVAVPVLALLAWFLPDREEDVGVHTPLDGPPGVPRTYWLEDAYGSWSRGTHISTLAVRYDVEPELLREELDRIDLAGQAVTLPAAGARRRRAAPAAWV
jgi:hypothetical protein